MKSIFKYLKKYTAEAIFAPVFKLLEALIELCVPIVVAAIVDNGILTGDRNYAVRMCILLLVMGGVGLIFSITAQFFSAKAACGCAAGVRSALFEKIQTLDFEQLDRFGSSTLITRMTGDINQVQTGVNLTLRLLLRSPFVVIGAMVFAFVVGRNAPSATLVFAVLIPALLVLVFIILLSGIPIYGKAQGRLDRATEALRSNLDGARVIRAFRLETREGQKFSERITLLKRFQLAAGRISGMLNPLTYVIVNIAIMVLLKNGAEAVDVGILTQGELIALYNYMTQILVELIKMANLIITVTKSIACANRIGAIMAETPKMKADAEYNIDNGNEDNDIFVSFKNVSFSYGDTSENVLFDINLDVKKGETVGIIGGTGSGKTTLVSLIPRLYDISDGSVTVGGKDVRGMEPDELRHRIGYVAQHASFFRGTLRENMHWGYPDASDEKIIDALKTAQIDGIINEKGNGLSMLIEQSGRNLSGGQRQRLNIARALVRQPEILILDDSSSALDRATDAALRRALRALEPAPTIFTVSQRICSVKDCDKIAVLDGGRLVGVGTHDELYLKCEVYREICDSQSGGAAL